MKKFRKSLIYPHQDLDDFEENEKVYEDRLETEKTWEVAFEDGERQARETWIEQEEW